MDKRILLAWELGSGAGHIIRLTAIASVLRRRGYQPVYAVHRLDGVPTLGAAAGSADKDFHQAPVWPILLGTAAANGGTPAASMGDTLADLGLASARTVEAVVGAWDRMLAQMQPAALVADFAPGALLAARGRIPSIAVGNGYTLPPADAQSFPIVRPDQNRRKHDEALVLNALNQGLRQLAREPLDRLPAVFSADRACVATFAEIDPYAEKRVAPHLPPFLPRWDRAPASGGREIFVYLAGTAGFHPAALAAIEQVALDGTAIRLFAPDAAPAASARLAAAGVAVESTAAPLEEIARRTALIVFHGGVGTASFALAAGIPQIVVAPDTEKWLVGRAVEQLGAGRCVRLSRDNPLEAALLAQLVREARGDESLAARARSLAPGFAARLAEDPAEAVAQQVTELTGGR
jgi:UDP:flavonoid glycosyltransferase YjiC (YdhE family)